MDNMTSPSLLYPMRCLVADTFKAVPPRPEEQVDLTWTTAWRPMLCLVPTVYLAYLTRRPNTYYLRLAVLPCSLYYIVHAAHTYVWTDPQFTFFNWERFLFFVAIFTKAVDFGLTPHGILKTREIKPRVYHPSYQPPSSSSQPSTRGPKWLSETIGVLQAVRGLGYQFSEGVYIPSPTRPQSPVSAFLIATLTSFFTNFFFLDLYLESIKLFFPLVGQPGGGTIFSPSLPIYPIPWRYIASTAAVTLTGFAIKIGHEVVYDLAILIGVGLCGQKPEDWPPIMEKPWSSDSVHAFWGRAWHQMFRRSLLVLGGYPAERATSTVLSLLGVTGKTRKKIGNIAMLFGAFVASGLFHEYAVYSAGSGFDHWGWTFFALQGPLMVGERLWKKMTGRPVRGWWGTLWLALVLLLGPQKMLNSWHERGLGASTLIPPSLSPVKQVIFPLARIICRSVGAEKYVERI